VSRDDADALCVFPSPMLFAEYGWVVGIVAERSLPTIYAAREGVELGGLMSYGANLADLARQTAIYVDKILKGAPNPRNCLCSNRPNSSWSSI